ncbi:MAG: hypothetical protein ABJF01_13495 [bacterium]
MKKFSGVAFAIVVSLIATAHVGSPNVLFDGLAGPYPVRVIVRPPDVVPGLAEVIVRVDAADVNHVTLRPVFWRAGASGAPKGDEASRVPGKDRFYTGQLWLMSRGSYSVYVTLAGARGSGTAIVPVNAFATGRLDLPPALGAILVVLGVLLVAGLLTIVRAAAGDSLVPAGQPVDAPARRRANRVMVIAAPVIALAVLGGAKWWNAVDGDYRRTMYRAPSAVPRISVDSTHRTLRLIVRDTAQFRAIFSPVVPDHGKMMHLFLVSTSGMQVFSHLHPIEADSLQFVTELPWAPAGRYLLFGDITLENGMSLTVSDRVDIPAAPGSVVQSDPDDSWDRTVSVTPLAPGAVRSLADGYTLAWAGIATPIESGQPTDLRFVVRDSAGSPVPLHPYLGMAGHAVVLRHDASVFVHLHPMGTIASVSQQVFALRDRGDTTAGGRLQVNDLRPDSMPAMSMSGELSFPYEFPKPGRYRLWVQVKPSQHVLTGVFDVDVR